MKVSYKRLWKLLIDKEMKRKDLVEIAGISSYTAGKLKNNENVSTDILSRICEAFDCRVEDIMEFVKD